MRPGFRQLTDRSFMSSLESFGSISVDESSIGVQKKKPLPSIPSVPGKSSKLLEKYKGMKSDEQIAHELSVRRMTEGMRKLLMLHNPVELSAICGVLGLKTMEKGHVSIELILEYSKSNNEVTEAKLMQVLNAMWEGALFEYLLLLGYPMRTCLVDPRVSIIKIWRDGGYTNSTGVFTPYYVVRMIRGRYENLKSADILTRTSKLKILEDKLKIAETKLIEEHDYRNILTYLQQINELRTQETSVRDYLINELEINRAKLTHTLETSQIVNESLSDLEYRYVTVTESLTEQLANQETLSESYFYDRLELEREIFRIIQIIKSFLASNEELIFYQTNEITNPNPLKILPTMSSLTSMTSSSLESYNNHKNTNTNTNTNNESLPVAYITSESSTDINILTYQPKVNILQFLDIDQCTNPTIKSLYSSLQSYREMNDYETSSLRQLGRDHTTEIQSLKEQNKDLTNKLTAQINHSNFLQTSLDNALNEIQYSASEIIRLQVQDEMKSQEIWSTALRYASQYSEIQLKLLSLKPFIIDGLMNRNETFVNIATNFALIFDIFNLEEINMIIESSKMSREDAVSFAVRKARLEELSKPKKKKKGHVIKKSGKSGGAKSSSKNKASSSSSSKKASSSSKPSLSPKKPAAASSKSMMSSKLSPTRKPGGASSSSPQKIIGSKVPPKKRK